MRSFSRLLRDDEGATLVEYTLVVALLAGISIAVLSAIGVNVVGIFTGVNNAFKTGP